MRGIYRTGVAGLAALVLSVSVATCGQSSEDALPKKICGTPADPGGVRPLVEPGGDWGEYSRVDRAKASTAPCVFLSGKDPVLEFQFWWTDDKPDLLYLADTGPVAGIRDPRPVNLAEDAVVGPDGAIVSTSCENGRTEYFTLSLQLPRVQLMDPGHREDIERFMRAYFPATVKTLDCR